VAVPFAPGFHAGAGLLVLPPARRKKPAIITLEASALECAPQVVHYRVWVEEDRRLRMEAV
jgi:hypothetical protein